MDKRKIVAFLASAGSTGLIYISLLYLFVRIIQMGAVVSVTVAYFTAMTFYFITNKVLVFRNQSKREIPRQVFQFALTMGINYAISLGIVLGVRSITGEVFSGSVIAGILTTVLAYVVFDRLLFASPK